METAEVCSRQAMQWLAMAEQMENASPGKEIECLQKARIYFAEAARILQDDYSLSASVQQHADTCRKCAEWMQQQGDLPGAIVAWQEAADMYRLLPGSEAKTQNSRCVQLVMQGMMHLKQNPLTRLSLLIAHHERRILQCYTQTAPSLCLAENTRRLADLLMRSQMPQEAEENYTKAIDFCLQLPPEETPYCQAHCRHKLADLLLNYREAPEQAAAQYRQAIALYQQIPNLSQMQTAALLQAQNNLHKAERWMKKQPKMEREDHEQNRDTI